MESFQFKIIYTSDVHGQCLGTNVAYNQKEACGLSRINTYLKSQKSPYLLLDNGDFLQGHVMLDYHRLYQSNRLNPVTQTMNLMGYDYVTLGNHDFNYGMAYLNKTLAELHAQILCANIYDSGGRHLFKPYEIKHLDGDIKIGIIGAVTHYIPHWEKPENIKNIVFKDAYQTINYYVNKIKDSVDYLIVLYHGGFEKDLMSHAPIGRPTDENQGYLISQIKGVDLLLTGHQHVPACFQVPKGPLVMQTGLNAFDFGEINVTFEKTNNQWRLLGQTGSIKKSEFEEDVSILGALSDLENETNTYLDQVIGSTDLDMKIHDPLSCRAKKHPLMQMMNDLQMSLSGADVSAASLPNQPIGLNSTITLRDLAANFVYPNTFVKLEITGSMLKKAIERSSEYYQVVDGKLFIDDSFLYPKVEHYNVDIFDGIDYIIDARKPKGERLVSCLYKDIPLLDHQLLTIILNNYRAIGGGDYDMYKEAQLIASYDVTLFDLFKDYILKHHIITVDVKDNFKLIY